MKKIVTSTILTGLLAFGTGVSAQGVVETADPGTTPDEFLFTFDQLLEELQLFLTFDNEKEAQLLLDFANERLAEASVMSQENKRELVQETFKDYLITLKKAQERVTEVIVEKETDATGEARLTEELEKAANLEEGITEELEDGLKEAVTEETEQTKIVANVVKELDREMVSKLREQNLGYGQIAQIFWLAKAAGKTVEEVAVVFTEENAGFGQAAKQLKVHPSQMKGLASGNKKSSDGEEMDTDKIDERSVDEGSDAATQAEEADTAKSDGKPDLTVQQVSTGVASVADTVMSTNASDTEEKKADTESKAKAKVEAVKVAKKETETEKKGEEQKREVKKKAEENQKEQVKQAEEKQEEETTAKEQVKAKERKENKEKHDEEESEEDDLNEEESQDK